MIVLETNNSISTNNDFHLAIVWKYWWRVAAAQFIQTYTLMYKQAEPQYVLLIDFVTTDYLNFKAFTMKLE